MRWKGILIHHTATPDTERADVQAHRRYHVETRGWAKIGYHAVCELIGAEYEVVAGRPLNMNGAHCPGRNATHLGFAFVGDFSEETPPPDMLNTAAQFLAGWCDVLGIRTDEIDPHKLHRATECPGVLDVDALRSLIDRYRVT